MGQDYEAEFWVGNSGEITTVNVSIQDCVPYNSNNVSILPNSTTVADGISLSIELDNATDAVSVEMLAKSHSKMCELKGDTGNSSGFVTQFWE